MKQNGHKDRDAPGLESMLEVKLEALLHDLLVEQGPGNTAKMLGVNYKTVARSVDSGKLLVHLRGALMGRLVARRDGHPAPGKKSVTRQRVWISWRMEVPGGARRALARRKLLDWLRKPFTPWTWWG